MSDFFRLCQKWLKVNHGCQYSPCLGQNDLIMFNNPKKDLEPTLYMVNTILFPSSKQPYRQTFRNAAMNIKIQVGNSHIFPTQQEVVDKVLGPFTNYVDKILPIIDNLPTPIDMLL